MEAAERISLGGPRIIGNRIIYKDHQVVCEGQFATPEYMGEIADNLSCEGSFAKHFWELEEMNNDGTWRVAKLPANWSTK